MSLPFELDKHHKYITKNQWRYKKKMKFTNEDFEMYIYPEYIKETNCDLCDNKFKSSWDRHLDHNHKTGEIRNIICRSCNLKKKDNKLRKNNSTGEIYIHKYKDCYVCKVGYKFIKKSKDINKCISARDDWLKENPWQT
jgi:hypothetical protein